MHRCIRWLDFPFRAAAANGQTKREFASMAGGTGYQNVPAVFAKYLAANRKTNARSHCSFGAGERFENMLDFVGINSLTVVNHANLSHFLVFSNANFDDTSVAAGIHGVLYNVQNCSINGFRIEFKRL